MNGAAAYTFAVACEAPADLRLISDLADRVLCQEVYWIDVESLHLHRKWQGLEHNDSHLDWHRVRKLSQKHLSPRAPHGHFEGTRGILDAAMARRALLLFARMRPLPDAVVLVRDTDGLEKRRRGLKQARDARPWPFKIVLAVAHTKRECWVLAGFDPNSEAEQKTLAEIKRELGFDPRLQADELTAAEPQALRSAKRVLNRLVAGSQEREQECWTACDLAVLAERGRLTGLADYLEEVRERLVPLLTRPT